MFHVPNPYRVIKSPIKSLETTAADGNNGMFYIPHHRYDKLIITCQVSDGGGWEHVSVSIRKRSDMSTERCPTWDEMCYVKDVFWDEDDVAMQLYPKKSEYVNQHPHVLHLWRPRVGSIPTPPSIFVGIKNQ